MTPLSWLGRQIGNYEFVSLVGAGGMGEVYKAHDSKLKREVAIKILPEQFVGDPDRVSRFQREAQLLASLNHPNIASIYGLEEDGGFRFLILELVEGETLAERLSRGPIALNDALQIAAQITEGLGAAHERGILHRDLKPANIKLTPDGKVKLLDFGLAKTFVAEGARANLSDSPTFVTESMPGAVLGTAPYMSPEQANGLGLDRRSDIFSFGAVLYEMLTGQRAFAGKAVGDVLAAVIRADPDWSKLPTHTPSGIRRLLRRCLQKDRNRRLQTAGDAQIEIDEALTAPDFDADGRLLAPARRHWLWPGVAALFIVASALLSFLYFRPTSPESRELVQFEIAQPDNLSYTSFAVSPDGRQLAFVATVGGVSRLWVRSMESVEAQQLAGTDGAAGDPFWSPDSRFIVFYAQGKLQKIDAAGSPAQTLCDISFGLSGGFWTPDDRIIFANSVFANFSGNDGMFEVSSTGGPVSPVTKLAAGEYAHSYPTLLPDGRHFLYTRRQPGETAGGIYLGLLDANPEQQGVRRLLPDVSKTSYVPSDSASGPADGYVLFVRGDALMAQAWDNQRLELVGDAIPIAERVPPNGLSASETGLLVYRRSAVDSAGQLTWFDRQGKMLSTAGEPTVFELNSPPALSPDGKRVAVARTDKSSGNTDIWLLEFAGGVNTRFTIDTGPDINPVWSPDGRYVAFAGQRNGVWGIYQKASSNPTGGEELLYKSGNSPARPSSWSRNGRSLLFSAGSPYDIWMLPLNTGAAQASTEQSRTLVHERFNERGARLSPDGRYYAYVSNLSGQDEIYVQTFVDPSAPGDPPTEGNWKISNAGGGGARWPSDGREIIYRTRSGDLMSVDVSRMAPFEAGSSRFLFKSPGSLAMPGGVGVLFWDVTSDGQRFLFAVPVGQNAAAPYTVVQNWQTLLRR